MAVHLSAGLITVFTVESNVLYTPWDWAGIIGTGQSLAVGEQGNPVKSTNQPYGNLKLSTDSLCWPIDPENSALTMVPLIEPAGRPATNYPSSWPTIAKRKWFSTLFCRNNRKTSLSFRS